MPTYRNKTDQELVIPNVGVVKPGETISPEVKLESANLEEVGGQTAPEAQTLGEAEVKE